MNTFLKVISSLNDKGCRYVVVGGFAAVMHGNNRFTSDLDLVVDLNECEAKKTIQALIAIGFQSRLPVNPLDFASATQRGMWIEEKNMKVFSLIDPKQATFAVDLFVESVIDFNELYARSVVLNIENVDIRICSIVDLIKMKEISGRPQDLIDLDNLRILRERGLTLDE
ncbi:MAG: hypothetical protein IT291_00345 [Deltaproteobacteria bacterium]|nr:hypothetical protein [Deltaproteobacteria bacterium]